MARVLVTGSADGLGRAAAQNLLDDGHQVVVHGWVPTRMGGPGASDDLRLGHVTQVWLAASADPEARGSGGYWYHRRLRNPHPAVHDVHFQDELLAALARSTGTPLEAGRAAAGRDGALPD